MEPLRIGMVTSEVTPFAKTGGLADVTAALTRYLAAEHHDVRLLAPEYRRVREEHDLAPVEGFQDIQIKLGEKPFTYSVDSAKLPESRTRVFFVRCPELYDRDALYTSDPDEPLRFGLLCRAALDLCQRRQWAPDVLHCHDWHASLIPLYLKGGLSWDKLFEHTKTVLTIHNIGYQGVFGSEVLPDLDLEGLKEFLYQEDLDAGFVSFLKTGILYADVLTTVSRTYASEIQTSELGMGLETLLAARADNLVGIVNGVDYGEWDPALDPRLPHRFRADDLSGKALDKKALLSELELQPAERAPLLGIVSRLTAQKGLELLLDVLPVVLRERDVRVAVLGSGEDKYERYFNWLVTSFPGRVAFHAGFSEELAHKIEAASDIFLMPSRYEPCGLNQMYSLKYGTIPLVRKTGGLADTVEPFDPSGRRGTPEGTGFLFLDFNPEALYRQLLRALDLYQDEDAWARVVRNAMSRDFSWERQGREYVELYRKLCD